MNAFATGISCLLTADSTADKDRWFPAAAGGAVDVDRRLLERDA